ncbi:uncharacterized protein LOC118463666 isoform X1 [Anopheles albimanus]|uniref:uncharacterized protein LOC118463666 isoform X1 n=1 Tax=Anopheles albimanus TaxID=7167 RepID=UPI00163F4FAC|nr:uncharacterized protein LOC118463666 isoform X1 [Anopheles albimanus]XP_035786313.1 uncharacterized protein LOC118463666 isoform X1 [Anopheles albimanus]XP_035786314.1 uncharacterized protein LOC118463666 isoform X1 [Anopheles albimanus]
MANKANKDGVNFQQHLYYYQIGLCHQHKDREYSILYEGDDSIYGAFDDVILKEEGPTPGLYFFQAKQVLDSDKVMSLDDVFDMKKGIVKYMESYGSYLKHQQCQKDGAPHEAIYWTSQGVHEKTTKRFLQPCPDTRLPMQSVGLAIKTYRIEDWKTLLLFDIAWKWAKICNTKPDSKQPFVAEYICNAVASALAYEILEICGDDKVKFRDGFLFGEPEYLASVSDKVRSFRQQFQLACQQKKSEFDIQCFKGVTYDATPFGLKPSDKRADTVQFEHKNLDEGTLEQFFHAFRYYTEVPKGDEMLKIINSLFNGDFEEKLFESHLIPKQVLNKKSQTDQYISRVHVNSLIEMIKLKNVYIAPRISGITFSEESLLELRECLEVFANRTEGDRLLDICAPYVLEWTAYRVEKELLRFCTCLVIKEKDLGMLTEKLNQILETHIASELSTIVVLDMGSSDMEDIRKLLQKVKRIIRISSDLVSSSSTFQDKLLDQHIEMDFDIVSRMSIILDDRTLLNTTIIHEEKFKTIQKRAELYQIQQIVVKSDLYVPEERFYIRRTLTDDHKREITYEQLKDERQQRVTVIVDTAGQGKTIELLRIARYLNESDGICLFFRARTIADKLKSNTPESSVSFNGWNDFAKLLQIEPSSDVVKSIVEQCLVQNEHLYVLVDGLDEILESFQDQVIAVIRKLIALKPLTVIIAARTELKSKLKTSFNQAGFYHLNQFAYKAYFEELWLRNSAEPATDIVRQNVDFFLKHFDSILKRSGCQSFLEVPQLCKIMGTIYKERIKRDNFLLYNNYEIGSIYDTFIACQFENVVCQSFDNQLETHVLATELMKNYFDEKHAKLAYDIECSAQFGGQQYYKLALFGLVRLNPTIGDRLKSDVEFIHRTVLEYFLVRYFLSHDVEASYFVQFMKRYFCVSRANIADKFIDFFLNDETLLCKATRRTMRRFLEQDPQQLATYVRIALNNATFNTLGLLLREAPSAAVQSLVFRFGGVQDSKKEIVSNEINLKRLGERQLLLLMGTLQRIDSSKPLILNLLFEHDLNEEDILEVAIRKPFAEVFDKIMLLICEFQKQDTVAYVKYITSRLPRYVRALVTHCYVSSEQLMVDKIAKICNEQMEADVVRSILTNFDLLDVVLSCIETVPKGKRFVEEARCDILKKVLSFLQMYLEEKNLPSYKAQHATRVATLQHESLKSLWECWLD